MKRSHHYHRLNLKLYEGYFTRQGRIGRSEYTKRLMLIWGFVFLLGVMLLTLGKYNEVIKYFFLIPLLLVPRVCLVFLYVRRLHDLNRSGWWVLLFAPLGLDFFLLMPALLLWPGTKGPNTYGPPSE